MTSKTIRITKRAYDSLKAMHREKESFSDVILRLTVEQQRQIWARLLQRPPDPELAAALDDVVKDRSKSKMRAMKF